MTLSSGRLDRSPFSLPTLHRGGYPEAPGSDETSSRNRSASGRSAGTGGPNAYAATAGQTIALLNAQRAGNELPANIVEDPRLTRDCAAHDRYMALNHKLTHYEQPGDPGYSVGGAYAGENSVLSRRGNAPGVPKLRLSSGRVRGHRVRFTVSYSSVLRDRSATLTITPLTVHCAGGTCTTVAGHPSARTVVLTTRVLSLPLPARGHGIRLDLETNAFQLLDAPWKAAHASVSFLA